MQWCEGGNAGGGEMLMRLGGSKSVGKVRKAGDVRGAMGMLSGQKEQWWDDGTQARQSRVHYHAGQGP